MAEGTGQADQVLGVSVLLTAWDPGCADEMAAALEQIRGEAADLPALELPFVALATSSREKAEQAFDRLEAAGGTVEITRDWMTPDAGESARTPCPSCGSDHTQPFTHAGAVARVNRKCNDCGHLFKVRSAQS